MVIMDREQCAAMLTCPNSMPIQPIARLVYRDVLPGTQYKRVVVWQCIHSNQSVRQKSKAELAKCCHRGKVA